MAVNKIATCAAGIGALIAAPAFAADIAVKAPPPPPGPVYSWTGWYVGGNIGGGWGNRDVTAVTPNDPGAGSFLTDAPPPAPPSFNVGGVVGGVQVGYNWRFHPNWLLGFETDFDGSGMKGSNTTPNTLNNPGLYFADEHITWFGTARGRLGWLPSQNLLIYGTGGFAYGEIEHSGNWNWAIPGGIGNFGTSINGFSFNCGNEFGGANPCFAGSSRGTETGWTAGGGFELAFSPNWSVKGEYLFISLANKSLTETAQAICVGCGGVTPASFNVSFSRLDFNMVRVGLNYQFH